MLNIKNKFLEKIKLINNLENIKNIRAEFLGKKSEIFDLFKEIQHLDIESKKKKGAEINELKEFIAKEIEKKEKELVEKKLDEELKREVIDITLPVRKNEEGLIHPISKVEEELRNIMYSMGFSLTSGSEIENDWNCFEGLNIPKHHPARQMQDTFYLKNDYENNNVILLRTQTTSVDSREMKDKKPPFKFFTMGKTFRSEMDATHCPMFHQIDVVYVDENVNMQDLKNCLITIMKKFFCLENVPLRFRPSYFPFTSPSVEVDIKYKKTNDKIILGEGDDWIEILGAGMLHPNVLKNANIDINKYQGFAFAFGIERMAMLKYGIKDIRYLYDGDLRFLKQYGFKIYE